MSIGKVSLVIEATNLDEIMKMLKNLYEKDEHNLPLPIELKSETKIESPKKKIKTDENVKQNSNAEKSIDTHIKKEKSPEIVNVKALPYVSKDEVTGVLQSLITAKGVDVARNILNSFNCEKMSDINPEQYAAIAKACTDALI